MKRSSLKLTKKIIDSLTFKGPHLSTKDIRWDKEIPGFGVRIFPSGAKSFVISYRSKSRKILMKLGDYPAMTLEMARHDALTKLAEIIKGKDPLGERKSAGRATTMGELFNLYMERHGKYKKSGSDDQRRINTCLLPLRQRKIQSVTRAEIAKLHLDIGKRAPYEANRTIALLSKMFNLAKIWGVLDDTAGNPAEGIQKFRESKRDRWIRHEEMPRLATSIEKEENIYIRSVLWLYLLTGARKSELLKLTWADVDFDRKEIRLKETKSGKIHYIPISDEAYSIFSSIPRFTENLYIFPGKKEGQHLVNISKAWDRIRKDAGIPDVRLHDLRRTVGSWLATSGASLPLIGKVLNHSNPSTTQIYARLGDDPVRRALADHGKRMLLAAKTAK